MNARSATRRRPPGTRNGPAKVIRMPTPTVVRRRRAIKAGIRPAGALAARRDTRAILSDVHRAAFARKSIRLTEQETEIIGLVNKQRVRGGLPPLKFSPRLAVIARGHSYDMAMRHYLAHNSPDGVAPADRISGVGIGYRVVGENIYMDDNADAGRRPAARNRRMAQEPRASAPTSSPASSPRPASESRTPPTAHLRDARLRALTGRRCDGLRRTRRAGLRSR